MRIGRQLGILPFFLLLLSTEAWADYLVASAFDTETLTEGELRYGIANGLSPIVFSPTEFPPGSPTVITLNGPLRLDSNNLLIDGSAHGQGPGDIVIDGNSQTVFEIDADGCSILGLTIRNGRYGIAVDGRNATIGSQTAPDEIISNSSHGILIGSGTSTLIRGNFIGIRADGSDAGNGGDGVRADGPGTDYNLISKNALSGNQGLGIALINGANEGVAAPVIDEVTWLSDTEARVAGSKAADCGLELFTADTDADGPGEGFYYLASVSPDAGETWTIETVAGLSLGDWLTADQTTALFSTSEFSLNREFNRETPSPTPSPSATPTPPTPTPSTSPTETPTPSPSPTATPSPSATPTAKLPEPVYSFDLQTDPGWSRESDWAFGEPSGQGGCPADPIGGCGDSYGNPDPSAGHTGNNVYGYNLDGNYPNDLPATYYLTTSPLDLSRSTGTYLQFWRWLNVETAGHDHAYLQVSTDGTAWTRVWDNPAGPGAGIDDSTWTQVSFLVSDFADREPSVRFRWGMGRTDSIRSYSGWNLDDIQIWGVLDPSPIPTPSPITPTPTPSPSPSPSPTISPSPTASAPPTASPPPPSPTPGRSPSPSPSPVPRAGDTFGWPFRVSANFQTDADTAGFHDDYRQYSCFPYALESGPDAVYSFEAGDGTISVSLTAFTADLDLFLCDGPDRNACVDFSTSGFQEQIEYVATPGTYYLAVDGFQGAVSGYHLEIAFRPSTRIVRQSGDYNGDGTADIAVFRKAAGLWSVRNVTRAYFGGSLDQPVPGDYDGDGTADMAVFRSTAGLWSVRNVTRVYFGSSLDLPVPQDYDGDGRCDAAGFRPSSGLWSIRAVTRAYFGSSDDQPAPADYNGDGSSEAGIYRPGPGLWAARNGTRLYFGVSTDVPLPADYSGDGADEAAIFRPSLGLWAIYNLTRYYFGSSGDDLVPADYNGDGFDDAGIFRGATGMWGVKDITRAYFGSTGDIPVTR